MNLKWLYNEGKTFIDIMVVLGKCENKDLLHTSFVNNLLGAFWQKFQWIIFKSFLVPFSMYALAICNFLIAELTDFYPEDSTVSWHMYMHLCTGFIFVCSMNQILIEVQQFSTSSKVEYFTSHWNLYDFAYLILGCVLMVLNYTREEYVSKETQLVIAAIFTIFIWMKLLDWLRLSRRTAFFISLMFDTLWSIRYFCIVMMIWYTMFSTVFYLLDQMADSPEDKMIPNRFTYFAVDGFI